MVWERSVFFRVPDGLASRKETETAPGQPFGRFLAGFCGFDILIWLWYDFDTLLIRLWYDFDTVLIWFQWVGFRKRNRNSPGTGFRSIFQKDFDGFDMILIWLWYDFDTILIRSWYGFDMILIRFWYGSSELASEKETETAQGQVFGRFSKVFGVLIWFWYDFDTLLMRLWYDFDLYLIRFWIWFRWIGFKSHVWPNQESELKPYQNHI